MSGADNIDREHGVAMVTSVSKYGCLAQLLISIDSCRMDQDEALQDIESQLVGAIADVRALRFQIKQADPK